MTDDFMALTLDVWSIPPESARRVGHPAPFPVELPEQLIRLYTFADDLVLDPFMGSGSALVAAARLGRRYVGYDLDAELRRDRPAACRPRSLAAPVRPPSSSSVARRGRPRSGSPSEVLARRRVHDRGAQQADPQDRRHRRLRRHRRRRGDVVLRRRRCRSPAIAAGCCAPTPCGGRSGGRAPCDGARGDVPLVLLTTPPAAADRARATRPCGPPVPTPSSTPSTCCPRRAPSASGATPRGGLRSDPQRGFWTSQDLDRARRHSLW